MLIIRSNILAQFDNSIAQGLFANYVLRFHLSNKSQSSCLRKIAKLKYSKEWQWHCSTDSHFSITSNFWGENYVMFCNFWLAMCLCFARMITCSQFEQQF